MTKNEYGEVVRLAETIVSMDPDDRKRFIKWLEMDIELHKPENQKIINEYKKSLS